MNIQETSKAIKVLLVDDDPAFAKIVKTILEHYKQRSFVVTWKDSVESALTEIAHNPNIDVIITDYYFPTSNGLEFCLQLNASQLSVPIIFITAARDVKLAVEAMKLGVEDFLVKEDMNQSYLPRTIINILDRVTLRKQKQAVEKRLIMAENQAQAIRELIVTVCHEFNNPLAAIKISLELLQKQMQDSRVDDLIKNFEENFNKIENEIKKLRDFSYEQIEKNLEELKNM